MKTIVAIVVSLTLASCNSINATTSAEKLPQTPSSKNTNPELAKLEKRRERWEASDKCLRALMAVNGRVDVLCASVRDIHDLAKEIGVAYTAQIVDAHLEDLDLYERQLKDGIIDQLPQDEPKTLGVHLTLIDTNLKDNMYQIDMRKAQTEICLKKAQLGEVNYEDCKASVDYEYETYKQQSQSRRSKIENSLERFEQNYRVDP